MTAIIIANIVSALAAACIAIYAIISHRLSKEIKESNERKEKGDEEFRQQVSDLYEAIVISNSIGSTSGETSKRIGFFKEHYKGKTPVFEKRG